MTTKKPKELRIKRSKRKPILIKRTALKDQRWYAQAARTLSIKRDSRSRDDGAAER
jgi:hypothetical protein